jgi:hypothetical protein
MFNSKTPFFNQNQPSFACECEGANKVAVPDEGGLGAHLFPSLKAAGARLNEPD